MEGALRTELQSQLQDVFVQYMFQIWIGSGDLEASTSTALTQLLSQLRM